MLFKKNEVFPQAGFPRFFTLNFVTVSSFIISYSFLISYLEILMMHKWLIIRELKVWCLTLLLNIAKLNGAFTEWF